MDDRQNSSHDENNTKKNIGNYTKKYGTNTGWLNGLTRKVQK